MDFGKVLEGASLGLRCFIAINLQDSFKESIGAVIDDLRKSGADVKWVTPGNVHLTIKFLGETEESRIGPIRESLLERLSPYSPFYIKISGVGSFPLRSVPRVIWIGVRDSEPLARIRKEIDEAMSGFGYPPEDRPFSPHLTLGRVRSRKRIPEMLRRLESFGAFSLPELEVRHVDLMESALKPGGAEYRSLAEIPFGWRTKIEQG